MKFLAIFLAILTALGGFVEVGELLFSINAGSKFAYELLWVVLVGTIGIIVYCEMAGRIAAVTRRPVFELIRENVGPRLGLLTLSSAAIVGLLTCAAEIGGVAYVLKLIFDLPYRLYVGAALVFFLLVIWLVSFKWIERIFGVGGLFMLVFLVTAYKLGPDWSQIGHGLIPHMPSLESRSEYLDYAYFAVALLSSIMLPYETYFYASGGIEDGWKPSDVPMNRIISAIGMSLGGLLAAGIVTVGAEFYRPAGIDAQLPGSAPIGPIAAFGEIGLLLALLGMFFAFAGATIENCLSVAYNISQFFGWSWGKRRKPLEVPRFTASWIVVLVLATTIITTGLDPVQVVEYSIVFSVVILPLSYFPILRTARDKALMGARANGRIADTLGFLFLFLVTIAALAALPLLILTHGGES